MQKLTSQDLYSPERYAQLRAGWRARAMAHKRHRRLQLGPCLVLQFEDRLTVQYQIQEMVRVERITAPEGLEEQLSTYNPLIPDGRNWKATLLIECDHAWWVHRGIAGRVWVAVGNRGRAYAVADEDLGAAGSDDGPVHFLRFELTATMRAGALHGAPFSAGVDHESCRCRVAPLPHALVRALRADLLRP
ncbi:hypothetical protein SVA_0861 [Sulfurifustis variabilis]|uniref:DUF3501 family protein n=1 Tax=Sulfurifustis variabilis TaxID=1675686 RepID=A0A1B4V1S9_9GAMM|nr:DUF3501 family protein [Sulfurifustis variabilis]BAU47440.1 hypothetical protein SVA_0861 [Sulfurifustis variabilis]